MSRTKAVRATLGTLLALGALNAFGGATYGLAGAESIPTEWLEGSPFSDYFIPSVVLGAIVGGTFLAAAIAVFKRWQRAQELAFMAGGVVLVWLVVQVAIIGYVSWMQPTTAAVGVIVLSLAWCLGDHRPAACKVTSG